MRVGDSITVYYDGKLGRACPGVILRLRAQQALVEFSRWPEQTRIVRLWFRRTSKKYGVWRAYHKIWGVSQWLGLPGDPYLFYTKRD